jgi:hypothetical protein
MISSTALQIKYPFSSVFLIPDTTTCYDSKSTRENGHISASLKKHSRPVLCFFLFRQHKFTATVTLFLPPTSSVCLFQKFGKERFMALPLLKTEWQNLHVYFENMVESSKSTKKTFDDLGKEVSTNKTKSYT